MTGIEQKPIDQIASATAAAIFCIVQSLRQLHPGSPILETLTALRASRFQVFLDAGMEEEARLFASIMSPITHS